jgi:phosphoribosylamine--glycine ligase / phosphoribosylformylglycinamidine cyclo-ligase
MRLPQDHIRVLLICSGGREHAIAWKITQSPWVEAMFVAPSNGGTAQGIPKVANLHGVDTGKCEAVLGGAKAKQVDFVVPSAEDPLVNGLVDKFQAGNHLPYFAL